MHEKISKRKKWRSGAALLISPSLFWLLLFFLIPLGIVLVYSFCQRSRFGGVIWDFTFANYQKVLDPKYLKPVFRSFWLAVVNTLICLIIGYPLAYYISKRSLKVRNILLLLVILPFWTNFLVRMYAWKIILREKGVLNVILESFGLINNPLENLFKVMLREKGALIILEGSGLINKPLEILFTDKAVIIGLIYGYLPFMILPLYSSIEKMNPSLYEAAYDLGANRFQAFLRVMLPLTLPGIIAGSILVFIPTLGAFVTPDLLGGGKTPMIGNLIENQFSKVRDWPFGSALSFMLLSMVLALLFFRIKFGKTEEEL